MYFSDLLATQFIKILVGKAMPSLIGWLGTGFYLLAYVLISFNKLKADKPAYHILNVLGAVGLIVHALNLDDGPNLICNLAWLAIAMLALFNIFLKKSSE